MKLITHNHNTIRNQLDTYEDRAKSKYLKWCTQIINHIENIYRDDCKILLNDIGCNYFQLYKEIKKRNLQNKYDYYGYDLDQEFINIGLKYLPELRENYKIADVGVLIPRSSEITVLSAVLEHSNNYKHILENVIKSDPNYVYLRTFVGKKEINFLMDDINFVSEPYFVNQFSCDFFNEFFFKNNFEIEYIKDEATNNSTEYEVFKGTDIKRKMFIIFAKNLNKSNI